MSSKCSAKQSRLIHVCVGAMSGINEAERLAQDKVKQLERDVEDIKRYPEVSARKKAAVPANQTMKEARAACNALRKLVNTTEDQAQKGVFKKRLDEYVKKIDGLKIEITNLTKAMPKGFKAQDAKDEEQIFGQDADMNTAGGVMTSAARAQAINLDILRDVQRDAHIIRDTGDAIINQLALDDEKIAELDKELNTLQANLTAAKGEVEWFARQMATDKCFMMLLFALMLGLAGLVFYKIYTNRTSGSSHTPAPTTLAPPPAPTASGAPTTVTTTTTHAATTTTAAPSTTKAAVLGYAVEVAWHLAASV